MDFQINDALPMISSSGSNSCCVIRFSFARRQSLFCQSESYFLTLDSHYSYINKDRSVILYEIECNNSEKHGLYIC